GQGPGGPQRLVDGPAVGLGTARRGVDGAEPGLGLPPAEQVANLTPEPLLGGGEGQLHAGQAAGVAGSSMRDSVRPERSTNTRRSTPPPAPPRRNSTERS